MRIDVPTTLLNAKREFDQYGYTLRNELGADFKRNLRYDDANRTLVLDVKYPGTTKWERITYEQAKRGNRIAKLTPNAVSAAPSRTNTQPIRPSTTERSMPQANTIQEPSQQPETVEEMEDEEIWT